MRPLETRNHEPLVINLSLLPPKVRIVIAVSGGADSVALLHLLHEQARQKHWRLTVAHLNHGIRGLAADADADFVAALAKRLRLPCVIGKANVPVLAKRRRVSLEMAARDARYAFLRRTAKAIKADVIATAHTLDDQIETLLLKLVRGSGGAGLSGMDDTVVIKGMRIVRPLLKVSRVEIERYLKRRGMAWREDESNRDKAFLRNRVRHELIPLLEREYNPKIRSALKRTREILSAEEAWMDEMARALLGSKPLTVSRLGGVPLAARRRMIRMWLVREGLPETLLDFDGIARVETLLHRHGGSGIVELSEGWQVHRTYDDLSLSKAVPEKNRTHRSGMSVKLEIPGTTQCHSLGLCVKAVLGPGVVKERGKGPGDLPARATLDAGKLGRRRLSLRYVLPGDRMRPYGMAGSRKVQDILVDAKVPREKRPLIPVLVCEREIVWLPGYRIARDWAVTDPDRANIQLCLA